MEQKYQKRKEKKFLIFIKLIPERDGNSTLAILYSKVITLANRNVKEGLAENKKTQYKNKWQWKKKNKKRKRAD